MHGGRARQCVESTVPYQILPRRSLADFIPPTLRAQVHVALARARPIKVASHPGIEGFDEQQSRAGMTDVKVILGRARGLSIVDMPPFISTPSAARSTS